MDLREELSGCRMTMPLIQKEISVDISEEVTLPDYLPEIRKVLYVKESPLSPARFIGGKKADVSGVVDYTLVYVSGEGLLSSAPISAEYSYSLPLENIGDFEISEGLSVMAHTLPDVSSVRLIAPRRLQIKSRLRSFVSVWGKMLCSERIVGDGDGAGLERLRKTVSNAEILCESSDMLTLEDEYILPSAEMRIVSAESAVSLKEASAEEDLITLGGEVVIRLLVDDRGRLERVVRRLPFEAETELDAIELGGDQSCSASGYLTDLSIKVEEGSAKIEASLMLEVCLAYNRETAYTSDAYSTERKCRSESKVLDIPTVILNENLPLSLNERVTLEELGIPEEAELADISAYAMIDSASLEDGKYVLRGSCRYFLVFTRDREYAYADLRLPIRYECDKATDLGEISSFDVLAEVISCKGRADRDSVSLESELLLAVTLLGSERAELLERAELGEPLEKRRGVFAVCYPSPDDTLWSVSKRYAVDQSSISGDPQTDRFVMIEM